jgi:hypothetical protein
MLASEIARRLSSGFAATKLAVGYDAHLEACKVGTDEGLVEPITAH